MRKALGLFLLLILVLGAPPAIGGLTVLAVSNGRVYNASTVPTNDVGMVLGARAASNSPSLFLTARLDVALKLYQEGKIKVILVTGDGSPEANSEPAVMKDYLISKGVPAERIVEDPAGFDTYDSCIRARDVFGIKQLTVVTQDYHVRRAVSLCQLLGIDTVGVSDWAMRNEYPLVWQEKVLREVFANVKVIFDLVSNRSPQQVDGPSSAITEALDN